MGPILLGLGLVLLDFVGHRRSSVFGSDFTGFGSGVAGFCWSSEIVDIWVQFWLGLGPVSLGFCWSFVGFVLAVVGDGSEIRH